MSFEKKEWKYRDIITADELNRMEDGIEEALSSGDAGYSCEDVSIDMPEAEVTTTKDGFFNRYVATLPYYGLIRLDQLRVYFDEEEYLVPMSGSGHYGAPSNGFTFDFSTYPFSIASVLENGSVKNLIYTESASTHKVEISGQGNQVITSPCFDDAVLKVVNGVAPATLRVLASGNNPIRLGNTWAEIRTAFQKGRVVVHDGNDLLTPSTYLTDVISVEQDSYSVTIVKNGKILRFTAEGQDGYPSYSEGIK